MVLNTKAIHWHCRAADSGGKATIAVFTRRRAEQIAFPSGRDQSQPPIPGPQPRETGQSLLAGFHRSSNEIGRCPSLPAFDTNSAPYQAGGAVCLYLSNPVISGNSFVWNSANSGGAIYCANSNPTITGNVFSSNRAPWGGAIQSDWSTGVITENIFASNAATGGGAIYCHVASPLISGNTFSSDTGYSYGGAIDCYASNSVITENAFTANFSDEGGAVYCFSSSGDIAGNTFVANVAHTIGGAVYYYGYNGSIIFNAFWKNNAAMGGAINCGTGNPTLASNTFSSNSATSGGALCFGASDAIVRNSILWGDSALNGAEIYIAGGSSPVVSYSDVQGGWPGTGNINVNPRFVNPDSGNVHLHGGSPCIDTGDPASPRDPDSTRADMGSYCFDQSVTPSIELYPHDTPIVIPPGGGSLWYDGWVYNLTSSRITVDIWTYAILPNHSRYGPIRNYENMGIAPNGRLGMNNIVESVPGQTPAGDYTYVGYVGDFGSTVLDSSYFRFSKSR